MEEVEKKWAELSLKLANDIKSIREETGLTPYGFAKQLGKSKTIAYEWETGKRTPGLRSMFDIAEGAGYELKIEFIKKE